MEPFLSLVALDFGNLQRLDAGISQEGRRDFPKTPKLLLIFVLLFLYIEINQC